MGKFDRVDRLMEQAAAKPAPAQEAAKVLPAEASGEPRPAPGQLGRQLLGNLDPLVPVLGRALQAFPHTGVQAVGRGFQAAERFLPFVRMFAGNAARADVAAPNPPPVPTANADHATALESEVRGLRERVLMQEDQLRRTRDSLERTVAEQGTLAHLAHQLQDRSRLLTAGLFILLLLVVVQVVLLAFALRR